MDELYVVSTGKKIICALSEGSLILHDLERKRNEFSDPQAHDDDINQATFLDSNIIISGSDDALLRVRFCSHSVALCYLSMFFESVPF